MGGDRGHEAESDFRAFYEGAYGQLVAHLYALTGDLGDAQDAAQEAFVRAWSHWGRLSAYENPVAWVRLTGQRIAISRWRRARTALRSWVRHGEGSPLPGPGPESVALVEALRRLPEAQRSALVLHHMGGRAVAEIAAEEGVPVGTVKARLHRGRQALAELLGEEDGEGGLRMPLRQPEVPSGPKSASAPKPGQPPRPRSEPEQQRGAAEAGPAPAVPEQRSGRERNLKRTLSARG
ncbi:RNA polymerase sigma-70 factor (ECF subfamily) [Kitasatospora gansuensis]|uniref:RNA polymerase sigma-70 factor (ECF subfamily) n=1 Tax=Kitasatospora gansuensis TaxID=258050 RepID=A0A7W7SEY7_9ACTN|nr:SigE family RNA polymerase sigma factor [Kitasatospora gansuensis]MBB4949224.1 RNA polymerase sigma-70 factor (ECF subfamily) [Kitasatospora gansuensis]